MCANGTGKLPVRTAPTVVNAAPSSVRVGLPRRTVSTDRVARLVLAGLTGIAVILSEGPSTRSGNSVNVVSVAPVGSAR